MFQERSGWSQKSGDITIVTACGHCDRRMGPFLLRFVMYSYDYFHRPLPFSNMRLSSHALPTTSRVFGINRYCLIIVRVS